MQILQKFQLLTDGIDVNAEKKDLRKQEQIILKLIHKYKSIETKDEHYDFIIEAILQSRAYISVRL